MATALLLVLLAICVWMACDRHEFPHADTRWTSGFLAALIIAAILFFNYGV